MTVPALVVLDFDGVVADGMNEFFESSWRAWARVRGAPLPAGRRDELRARFARLRPVVEAGWEMALLPALLAARDAAGDTELEASKRWAEVRDAFLREHRLEPARLAEALDSARDAWCAADRGGWLQAHRFYPGIADWLRRLLADDQLVYVLSTKERRFLEYLLAWQAVPLAGERVIGKTTPRRAKWDVIQELMRRHDLPPDGKGVWFVEDRLATLRELRHDAPQLGAMQLFLASWGYVFPRDIAEARAAGIPVLTLAQASGPFAAWVALGEAIRGFEIFRGLDVTTTRDIGAAVDEIFLSADAYLFREGDPADAVFLIRSGSVRVVRHGPTGAPIVSRLGPGDVVGEGGVLGTTSRTASAITDVPSVFLRLGRSAFESLAARAPELRARLEALADRRRRQASPRQSSTLQAASEGSSLQAPPEGEAGIRLVGHRHYVGGMWEEIGRLQLAFLVEQGLRPSHCLLDIGCGALRGGVHFIDYLAPGQYLGLDKEPLLIACGLEQELGLIAREQKRPELVVSGSFEFHRFSRQPDFSIAQSLFTHLTPDDIARCLRSLRDFVAANHVCFASFFEGDSARNPAHSNSQAPFYYSRGEMERFGAEAGWQATYVGHWKNPRGLMMMRYAVR